MVTVICYEQTYKFDSVEDARRKLEEWRDNSSGAERNTYCELLIQLNAGEHFVYDSLSFLQRMARDCIVKHLDFDYYCEHCVPNMDKEDAKSIYKVQYTKIENIQKDRIKEDVAEFFTAPLF